MFEQKATETVTLTRSQLQAILELITKIGGLGYSGQYEENNRQNQINDSNVLIIGKNNDESSQNNSSKAVTTAMQWNNNYTEDEKHKQIESENWQRYKKWVANSGSESYAPVIREPSSTTHYTLSPPATADSSSSTESRVDLRLLSSLSKNSTNFHRYAHINNSEFDMNELQQKQVKALEYRRALAEQREEKLKKMKEEAEKIRLEEQLMEKRCIEQQMRMKLEYENELKLLKEKQKLSESKREAVIAAIESTPAIRKRQNLAESSNNLLYSSGNVAVATILPQSRNKDMFVQTDESQTQLNAQSSSGASSGSRSSCCDKEVQTDVELLFRWLSDMKYSTKKLNKSDFARNNADECQLNSGHKSSHKLKSSRQTKRGENTAQKPVWGMNAQTKYYVKNTDKYPNGRSHEIRKKCAEINGCQTVDKKQLNKSETSLNKLINNNNDCKNANLYEVIDSDRLSQHIRRSSSMATLNSSTDYNLESAKKKIALLRPNANFLPQIDLRPHSRRKWYSQQTFNPDLLA